MCRSHSYVILRSENGTHDLPSSTSSLENHHIDGAIQSYYKYPRLHPPPDNSAANSITLHSIRYNRPLLGRNGVHNQSWYIIHTVCTSSPYLHYLLPTPKAHHDPTAVVPCPSTFTALETGANFIPFGTGLTLFSKPSISQNATVCGLVYHGANRSKDVRSPFLIQPPAKNALDTMH